MIAIFPRFHLLKVGLRIEIIYNSTVKSFFNGCTQKGHFPFLLF